MYRSWIWNLRRNREGIRSNYHVLLEMKKEKKKKIKKLKGNMV